MLLRPNFFRGCCLLALTGALGGCSVLSPKPDLAHYYTLKPITEKVSPAPPPDPTLSLGIYYPEMPTYLQRPQIVVDMAGGQKYLDEYHRWLEPIGDGFGRALAQDVAQLSDSTHVAAYPLPPGFGHDLEVHVIVAQFDGTAGGDVSLHAEWRITGPGGQPAYFSHETVFTYRSGTGPDRAGAYVDALDHLILDLAREIVVEMPEVHAVQAAGKR